jgi:hypothetical protein
MLAIKLRLPRKRYLGIQPAKEIGLEIAGAEKGSETACA